MNLEKTVTIPVGSQLSDAFPTGPYSRGSFHCTAVASSNINIDVSNDGTNWDALANARGSAFADITAPSANLPRQFPADVFQYKWARFNTASNQATAAATIKVTLFGGTIPN